MTERTTSRRRYYNNTGEGYEASRYSDRHMGDYRDLRNATLASALSDSSARCDARMLEVGCGTGLTLEYLSHLSPDYRLFGIDLSETMLLQAGEKASRLQNKPRLAVGDAGRLPYPDGLFDVTLSTRFIHQFTHEDKKRLWREFQRVTRKDGIIIVEFYARPYHWLRYYLGDGAKGRPHEGYFRHFPTRREVRDIVSSPMRVYPLRMPGSRVVRRFLGEKLLRQVTRMAGLATRGLLTDEYFVVSRNR